MDRRSDTRTHALTITVGARKSPLSKVQVLEVHQELTIHHPNIIFSPIYIDAFGDIDQKTSLQTLDRTNFFTKEIDEMLIEGKCRIAIHSAKDLPDPIPPELQIVALTKGLDPRDALVFKNPGYTLATLPLRSRIGTSSLRRIEMLKKRRPDCTFVDIRGNIDTRLQLMETDVIDALVVAECALLRLQLQSLPRYIFDDETAPNQGRLAILAQKKDHEMKLIFSSICDKQSST